jgi:cytidine deaminase
MKTKNPPAITAKQLKALLNDARRAAKKSYSPYSGFKVGAALLLSKGEITTGTNVECVSYGLTI